MGKLTASAIKAMTTDKPDLWRSDGNGLYIRLSRTGSKAFWFRKKIRGKEQFSKLGDFPDMSLAEARAAAADLVLKGAPGTITVREAAEQYLEHVQRTHRRPHMVEGYFTRSVYPAFASRKLADISKQEWISLVTEYRSRGARGADQLRSTLKTWLGYCSEMGWIQDNPMQNVTRRAAGYVAKPRDRVLNDDEIRLVWSLDNVAGQYSRFLLQTGCRIGEARKGHQDGTRWIIPASISKNKKAHWVYLTETARKDLPLPGRSAEFLQHRFAELCEKHGITDRFTPHDLRRTVVTRLNDLGVYPHVVERIVNHSLPGVMGVYNRSELEQERIDAMLVLEKHIHQVISG